MNLAEAVVKVVGDFSGLRRQTEQEATRAGSTFGQRFKGATTKVLGAGLAFGGAALTAAAAVGTKGVIELDNAMADYQASTGATADEVARAAETTEDLFRNNLGIDSYQEAAEVQAALRTQLNLTEEQIDATADSFVDWARVTGQDATAAVGAMDDVLDAWNLDADASQGIMDQLTASHQQFGTDVGSSADSLAKLAPALSAANFTIDDGVGLLNLFAASGVDASKAPLALQSALDKVESPEELQAIIDKIAATEDPFERATLAIDTFGSRAGTQLANALGNMDGNLEDFNITAEESAGTVATAAEAMDSSFGRQAQLWIRNIQGMATDLVQGLGPGIGGLATAVAIGAPALGSLFGMMRSGAVGAIPMLLGALGKVGPLLMGIATGPIGIIIAAVAGLFLAWQTNFLGIRDIVGNVVGWLNQHVVPLVGTIFGAIADAVSAAVGIVTSVIEGIVAIVSGVVDAVGASIDTFRGIFETVGAAMGGIVSLITAPISGIIGIVGGVVDAVGGFFDWLTGKTDEAISDAALMEEGYRNAASATSHYMASAANMGGTPPPSYQSGAWELMRDQIAQLHAGEMVVPPGPAEQLRRFLSGQGPRVATAAAGGGDIINVYLQDKLPPVRRPRDIERHLRTAGEHGLMGRRRS